MYNLSYFTGRWPLYNFVSHKSTEEMKKIFIINGGQVFEHSGGLFNRTLSDATREFFSARPGFEVRYTDINDPYDPDKEVENYVWADVVIYHTPIWWFQVPFGLKKYIDEVFSAGHQKGSDKLRLHLHL